MNITYTKKGDFYYPDLVYSKNDYPPLGKYGRMSQTYLKENFKSQNSLMLRNGKQNHLKMKQIMCWSAFSRRSKKVKTAVASDSGAAVSCCITIIEKRRRKPKPPTPKKRGERIVVIR